MRNGEEGRERGREEGRDEKWGGGERKGARTHTQR